MPMSLYVNRYVLKAADDMVKAAIPLTREVPGESARSPLGDAITEYANVRTEKPIAVPKLQQLDSGVPVNARQPNHVPTYVLHVADVVLLRIQALINAGKIESRCVAADAVLEYAKN